MSSSRYTLAGLLVVMLLCGSGMAQMWTGSITGTVTDPSNLVVVGANVTLTNQGTGDSRAEVTNESGSFTFTAVPPGTYTLKVANTGFKTLERTGMVLTANDHLSAGPIQLALGAPSETVSVESTGASVETTGAEQSALISNSQMGTLLAKGRDIMALLRVVPGAQYIEGAEVAGGTYGVDSPNVSGVAKGSNRITMDGIFCNDMTTMSYSDASIGMEAVGEVRVMLNSYQAEYGGNGSMIMNIVSKSGTRDFHGSGYWFKRHEMFNANNFFNNRNGVARPRYRYNTEGGSIGGPVYIPHLFNTNKDKLFFFFNMEQWQVKNPGSLIQNTMPTALERTGDFSQTVDLNNKLIPIINPLTGQQFTGNTIPASRLNKYGQGILNVFPLPNFTDKSISKGQYNYQFQEVLNFPHHEQLYKIDWMQSPKNKFAWHLSQFLSDLGGYACAACPSNWGLTKEHYHFTEWAQSFNYTRIFTPKIVNEFTMGVRHNVEAWLSDSQAELNKFLRTTYGLTGLGMWNPTNNPLGIVPQASFGGVPNGAAITYDRRVLDNPGGADVTISFLDTLSIIHGPHMFKLGMTVDRVRNWEGQSAVLGSFVFDKDTNNPLDSNYAYSNALLGNFRSYSETITPRYPEDQIRDTIIEWFAQDTWRVTRKLTLDYGLRFIHYPPMHQREDRGYETAMVALERYDPTKAAKLYKPVLVNGKRLAQNPLTGEILPAVLIGGFVPGSGSTAPGAVLANDPSYPSGYINPYGIKYSPRLGIAYDPFGKGKTAIRAGGAILYTKGNWNLNETSSLNAPAFITPTLYYGNIDTYLGAAGTQFPTATYSNEKDQALPTVYNLSLGIQQDVGHGTVVDVSYVSTLGRHLYVTNWNLSTLPYGTRFLPQSQDATTGRPLPDVFLNRTPGYTSLIYQSTCLPSSYHSMRIAVNRRFTKGLEYGASYVWSKTMDYSTVPDFRSRQDYYGLSSLDFTHNLVINYILSLPKGSKLLPSRGTRLILDNWQLSGITSFVSGAASGVGFNTVDGTDQTGGGDGQRIINTGSVKLDRGGRTLEHWFNTANFARPGLYPVLGNAGRTQFRGPGINNWDISVFKNVPVYGEGRAIQFRLEMYNAFNHTQWSGVNSTARFDAAGNQVNAQFGQITSARNPRQMQMSLRFSF